MVCYAEGVDVDNVLRYIANVKARAELIRLSRLERIAEKEGEAQSSKAKPASGRDTFAQDYTPSVTYNAANSDYSPVQKGEYTKRLALARQDFTNMLDKSLEILPRSLMGGVLGFTYLGSGKMARRDDLFGDMALMVDVHEAIHTPDEYETRVLTDWILRMEKPKYKR